MSEAEEIFEKFRDFSSGIRLIMLIDRAVSNTNKGSRRWHKKYITKSPVEFQIAIEKLLELMNESRDSLPEMRIYSSVNERNFDKAERYFRYRQIEVETLQREDRIFFYQDAYNNFFSALAKPTQAMTKNFLLDIDDKGNPARIWNALQQLGIQPIFTYETKNGWHMVTKPFNPHTLVLDKVDIKKDGLLLLKWWA